MCVAAVAIPDTANALTVYLGSDSSQDVNSSWDVAACDLTSDGNNVYSSYDRADGSHHETARTVATNSCRVSAAYSGSYRVRRHKVCRDVSFAVDPCSGWAVTGW
ncbi:hypothetical protein GCM10027610_081710 [Dactylosporangium cerinum]